MNKDKITYIKDKEQKALADKNCKSVCSLNAQNPIESKFIAFRKTKKQNNPKDLL